MTSKNYPCLILLSVLFLSACVNRKRITKLSDYAVFMQHGVIEKQVIGTKTELGFWERHLQNDTGSYVDMLELAANHLRLFQLTGNLSNLHKGESFLKRSTARLNNSDPDILFALSQNSITLHKFRDAAFYNDAARHAKGDMFTNRLLGFDAAMELGEYGKAGDHLESLKNKSGFDYLIRKAKWEDHHGRQDAAILLMEEAFEQVKNKNKSLYCWTLTNLGDMYAHAGRIGKSYEAYLKVLQKDATHIFALKGIAHIAYSYDRDFDGAKNILQYILSQTKMPDCWLMLAEIEECNGHAGEKNKYIQLFLNEVKNPAYGDMYNKYLINIYTDELQDPGKALAIASQEVNNRSTPETYDWLAWSLFNAGEIKQSFAISSNYVAGKNFEPDALYHTALIFAANGKKEKAQEMLKKCLESSFELGPIATARVRDQLSEL